MKHLPSSFVPLVEQKVLEGCFVLPGTHYLTLQAVDFSLSLVIVMRKQMDLNWQQSVEYFLVQLSKASVIPYSGPNQPSGSFETRQLLKPTGTYVAF